MGVYDMLNNYNDVILSWKEGKKTVAKKVLVNKVTKEIEYYKDDIMDMDSIGWNIFNRDATEELKGKLNKALKLKINS